MTSEVTRVPNPGRGASHDPSKGDRGSMGAYKHGCRCPDCRAANTAKGAAYRARLRAERIPESARDYWADITPWNPDDADLCWFTDSPGSCSDCGTPLVWTRARTMVMCLECNTCELPEQVTQHVRAETDKQRRAEPDRKAARIARNTLNSEREMVLTALSETIRRLTIPADRYPESLVREAASVRGELKGYIGDVTSAESMDELTEYVEEFLDIIHERANPVFEYIDSINRARSQPRPPAPRIEYEPPPMLAIEPPEGVYYQSVATGQYLAPEPEPEPTCNRCGQTPEYCPCPYFTCDWEHGILGVDKSVKVARYHVDMGNAPLHNNPAEYRLDLCVKCWPKFQRNPEATLKGYGYRYWQAREAQVKR